MAKHTNTLYNGDNLYIMNGMNSNSVDLIYLDPPFNSKRMYSAPIGSKAAGSSFKDMWTWADVDIAYLDRLVTSHPDMARYIYSVTNIHGKPMGAYLSYMAQRIFEMHRILKDTGTIYLHCDPTASHYLKIIMDEIFGNDNFRNEIVWHFPSMSRASKDFPKKHNAILRYTKSSTYIFDDENVLIPYSKKTISRAKYAGAGFARKSAKSNYLKKEGKTPDTVWEIPHVKSKIEHTGYPTQKPLKLLYRIIQASSKEGNIVFDPFCGCATTMVAAQQLNRKWIGIDIEEKAVDLLQERLSDDAGIFKDFVFTNKIPVRSDIHTEDCSDDIKQKLYKEQENGKCNGCKTQFEIQHLEIDHIIPQSKGGQHTYENYQLLCGNCNRVKGDRPMEFLIAKLKQREAALKYTNFKG